MRFLESVRRSLGGEALPLLLVIVLSYFTVVHNYQNPPNLFWDENYHIASAQKYLNHIYFMEPHPPLGKLLIAAGEKLLNANDLDNQFIDTDYGTTLTEGFSFAGYRLFPTLLAWLTAPLLFLIFFLILGNRIWALLLSFLYIFDNALLVHGRSAMLDSTMLFFSALAVLAFFLAWTNSDDRKKIARAGALFGLAFAGVMTTKVFGLLLILLIPALLWRLRPSWPKIRAFLGWGALTFVIAYCAVWYAHFALGTTVNPKLPDEGWYQATEPYKAIVQQGRNKSLFAFPVMLRDSLAFVGHYEAGVPRLDLCKEDENGSPWFFWPFGGRSISYRWETPGGGVYKYLYLQSNPVSWFVAFGAMLLACVLFLSRVFVKSDQHIKSPVLLLTFLAMYAGFFVVMTRIDRVMYLYHYFLPLLLAFVMVALVVREIEWFAGRKVTDEHKTWALLGLAACIFVSFEFFRPMTYNLPMTKQSLERRELLQIWDIKCANCVLENPYYIPKAG